MTRRLIVPGAAIVLAAMAVLLWRASRRDPWERLSEVVARSPHRFAAARFADLETHRPLRTTRSAEARLANTTQADSYDVLEAAATVLASSSDEHHKAIAAFLSGRRDDAQRRLMDLSASAGSSVAVWNDLAVVLAANESDDESLIAALAAVGRALDAEPSYAAARFNRAWIVEQLGLKPLAIGVWEDYLRIDGTSSWAVEARARVAALRAESANRKEWRDLAPSITAAAAGDPDGVRRAIAAHPQDARLFALNQLLPRWGDAILRGNGEAAVLLTVAEVIGETLQRTNGDTMIAEIVAAIGAAGDDVAQQRALAEAHVIYGEAAEHNLARRIAPAAVKFASVRPIFERASSPASLMSAYFCATTAVDRGDRAEAQDTLAELSARTPPSYRALHAQMHRLRGTIFFFEGHFAEARASYERARAEFIAIGETQNAIDTTSRLGGTLAALGRPREAWPIYRFAFRAAGDSGVPRVMQLALHAASFVALEEKRWDMAHALLDVEIRIDDANPRVHAESIVWRVLAAQNAGLTLGASSRMDDARKGVDTITDPDFRESARNDLRLLEALFIKEQSPQRSLTLLTEYIASARSRARMSRIPEILAERAAVFRRLRRDVEAERDLREAIGLIEERGNRVERDLIRDTFLGKSTAPYTALADLLDAKGDVAGAVAMGDLHRARILIDRREKRSALSRSLSVDALAASLDRTTALITYGLFEDRTVLYVVRANGLHRFETRVPIAAIEEASLRFVDAIQRGDDARAEREGKWLHERLITPAAGALAGAAGLVIVVDAPLDRIPFAALVQPDGRFLVEDLVLSISPAIRLYGAAHSQRTGALETVVSIGNPRVNAARYPSLPSLDAAAAEAREIASMYPEAVLLLQSHATESRVTAVLRRADVIHFGTHAVADPANADNSRLLLAHDDVGDAALSAAEVAEMDLHGVNTVVLAGCRTAAAGRPYGFVQNIAAAFLTAGAQHVVGSLWDIEDDATRTFSTALHRGLRSGVAPEDAVREAQLRMIGSYPIANWSALQLYVTN